MSLEMLSRAVLCSHLLSQQTSVSITSPGTESWGPRCALPGERKMLVRSVFMLARPTCSAPAWNLHDTLALLLSSQTERERPRLRTSAHTAPVYRCAHTDSLVSNTEAGLKG